MLENLTSGSIMATIVMSEPRPALVLLVEGPDEDAVLGHHLTEDTLGIVCGGRRNVVDSVAEAQRNGLDYVLGLVDRDLPSDLVESTTSQEGIVATDTYDLTADIASARPGVVGQVLTSHAHREVRVVKERRGEPVEEAVFDLATHYAGVRVAVQRSGYPIVLKGFDFSRVIAPDYATLSAACFVDTVRINDPKFVVDAGVRDDIERAVRETVGRRDLAGGHDIASAGLGLVARAGARQVSKPAIERSIRAFADCTLLSSLTCVILLQQMALERVGQPMFECFDSDRVAA